MEEVNTNLEQSVKILEYVTGHSNEMNVLDQLFVLTQMAELSEKLKPLYLKYAQHDEAEKFIIKL